MMNKKKILITGSCGYFLGNFIRKAVYEKLPYQFVSLDRVSANTMNSMYWNKNHTFYVADVRDQHIIDVIFQFEKPDIVIHGAAETLNSSDFISSNISGTKIVIDACIKHNVEKFIYLSTSEVYGKSDLLCREDSAINPQSLYAVSKYAGEQLTKISYQNNLNYNIVRLSNSYGPRQEMMALVPRTIKNILQNKKFDLSNNGLIERDWTHVLDHYSGILRVLNNGSNNEIYNISSNQIFTDIEVIHLLCNAMNRGHDLLVKSEVEYKQLEFDSNMDSSKIRNIGWDPKYKLKPGLVETFTWYDANQWFIK